eukprot:CAMPEP_0184387530 /NCGR_PEP_ID=MMETSP0007-20130409/10818_1 /TAXON_ID=97485 /ORGANISM="Prymnesium parvum, Strain Texoma1" /LENGTH=67 /DNA_ID=CAMNT_0026735969 /DNA_START=256 /DNA_END=459 /DNA_ORIENTATION=-
MPKRIRLQISNLMLAAPTWPMMMSLSTAGIDPSPSVEATSHMSYAQAGGSSAYRCETPVAYSSQSFE